MKNVYNEKNIKRVCFNMIKIENNILINVMDRDIILGTIKIPSTVNIISRASLAYCESLKEIILPNSVTSIDDGAFFKCILLKKIIIPNSAIFIRDDVFHGCELLEEIKLPETMSYIGSGVFWNCKFLKSITLPNNLNLNRHWFNKFTNPQCVIHHRGKKYKVEDVLLYY